MQNSTTKSAILARLVARTERIPLEIRFFTGPDTDGPETELGDCRTPARFQQLSELQNGGARIQFETTASVQVPVSGGRIARWLDLYADNVELVRIDLALMWRSSGWGVSGAGAIHVPEGAMFTFDVANS